MKFIFFWSFLFLFDSGMAQTPAITVVPAGIEFSDGTSQEAAAVSQNNGSTYNWNVYLGYSNGITGDVTNNVYEAHSYVLRVHHELYRELNGNGLPMNEQHHKTLFLKKDIDKASVDLYSVFNDNSVIDQLQIKFARPLPDGTTAEKFRITLNNVKIAEIKNELIFSDEASAFKGTESLRLVYQTMTIQHYTPNENVTLNYQY